VSVHRALGLIGQGRFDDAHGLLTEICMPECSDAQAWFLLGALNGRLGRFDEVLRCCGRAVELDPDHGDAHFNLAQAHMHSGRYAAAADEFRATLARQPSNVVAAVNLAHALNECGQFGQAEQWGREAIEMAPDNPDAYVNLGNTLRDMKHADEGEACFRRALAIAPGHPAATLNLGTMLLEREDTQAALTLFESLLARDACHVPALIAAGSALELLGRRDDALARFRAAVQHSPESPDARFAFARSLRKHKRLVEASAEFRRVLVLQPENTRAGLALAETLLTQGLHHEAVQLSEEVCRRQPDSVEARAGLLFALAHECADGDRVYREHVEWGRRQTRDVVPTAMFPNDPDPARRLRVGYVSADFCDHAAAFFIEPFLANHDSRAVEVICYSGVARPDHVTARLQSCAGGWRDVRGRSDDDFFSLVTRDAVDVLVDLSGHTGGHRLMAFARRLAPVQVTYLGYPWTTGLETMDYRLTDEVCDPEGSERFWMERLMRLEGGMTAYLPPSGVPDVTGPPACSRESVTFGSLNKLSKLTLEVVELWSEVLRAVPNSRLFLFHSEIEPDVADMLRTRFARHGIRPGRLILENRGTLGQHWLSLYGRMDIALDPFPWNGHVTTCEALWMGVPVVTLRGRVHAGRLAATVLTHAGLGHHVAGSSTEYVQIARRLARDMDGLRELRTSMRDRLRAAPICDGRRLAREIEGAYRDSWRRWCGAGGNG
jgi:predicted O-linked N-acetylglucosamine transferase (SPINDLY family)